MGERHRFATACKGPPSADGDCWCDQGFGVQVRRTTVQVHADNGDPSADKDDRPASAEPCPDPYPGGVCLCPTVAHGKKDKET